MIDRRKRRGEQGDRSLRWVDSLWRTLVRPGTIGTLLLVTGVITILAPTVALPDPLTQGWWGTAFHFDDVTRAAASMVAFAVILAVGLLGRESSPDVSVVMKGRPRGLKAKLPMIGLVIMTTAVVGESVVWWSAQALTPVSRVSLPVGRKAESYPAIDVTRSVKMTLPHRVQVGAVDAQARSTTLQFSTAVKPDEPIEHVLRANEPIDVDGVRYALVGIEFDERVPYAVLESGNENSIPAAGGIGSELQFTVDGPAYVVKSVVRDYLQAMGPAVELENEDEGRFWVFQRAHPMGDAFESPNKIRLLRLEAGAVAVLAVSAAPNIDLSAALGVLFVLGLGLFFGTEDRRKVGAGTSSLNSASTLTTRGDA